MQLPDDDAFIVQFPVWMLLHPTALSRGMLKLNGASGEISFPLFTDQDLAERFQASIPSLAHLTLGIAKDREAILMVLDEPDVGPVARKTSSRVMTILTGRPDLRARTSASGSR